MDYFEDNENQKPANLYDQFQDTMDQLLYQYQQNPKKYSTQPQVRTDKMQTKPLGFYNPKNSQKKHKKKNSTSSLGKAKSQSINYQPKIKSKPGSTRQKNKKQKPLIQAHSQPHIGKNKGEVVELIPEGKTTKETFGVSMLSRKVDYTDSDLMKQEIHELVNMLNKDPDARISLDLLKCLSPDIRSQLLNSNLINNISEIQTAYKNPQQFQNQLQQQEDLMEDEYEEELEEEEEEFEESLLGEQQTESKVQPFEEKEESTKIEEEEELENQEKFQNKVAKQLNKDKKDEKTKFPKLQLKKARELFKSYDGAKMTSTIVNIDIEEICFCLACAIQKHIEYFQRSYEEGLIEEYSEAYGQDLQKVPNPQQINNVNKRLLISTQKSKQNLKEIGEVNEITNNTEEGFKFNNVSDVDNSKDKSSTRYDAKFIQDDEMCYDPDITNPSNASEIREDEEILDQQEQEYQCEVEQVEPQYEVIDEYQLNQNIHVEDEVNQVQQGEFEENMNEVNVMESNDVMYQHQLSKISEKTVDYSNQQIEQQKTKRELQEFQKSRNEIESILRESLMGIFKPQTRRSMMQQSIEDSQKENMNFLLQSQNGRDSVKIDFSYASQYEEDLNDLVKDPLKRYQAKNIFDDCFNDKVPAKIMTRALMELPTKTMIQNYCKNILLTAQMEKEIPILSLVYIERLIINSGFYVTPVNWRRISFASLMVASKIWDDESFENDSFHKAFRLFTPLEINNMERRLLEFIDYKLFIKASDYAKYYFILRTFAEKNKKSFPLKELDLDRILFLQQNQNKAQQKLREIYQDPLNKTYEF